MSEKGNEKAAAVVNMGNKVEYVLCTKDMCFSMSTEFLTDPNVWIADTVATVHLTPHSEGLKDTKAASFSDSVTMGNGTNVRVKMIMQLPGMICDKHGNELKTVVLNEMTHLPQAKYNLFSLSRMVRNE